MIAAVKFRLLTGARREKAHLPVLNQTRVRHFVVEIRSLKSSKQRFAAFPNDSAPTI